MSVDAPSSKGTYLLVLVYIELELLKSLLLSSLDRFLPII